MTAASQRVEKVAETPEGNTLFSVPFPTKLNDEALALLNEMSPIVMKQTYSIDYIHSYGQDSPFFAGLSAGHLMGSRDAQTGYTYATPRGHDMYTGERTNWVDLTKRVARIHAFTVCYFGSEEFLPETPFVLVTVEFEGADTLFLGRLVGADPGEASLDWIGKRVGMRFLRNSKFRPTDVYLYLMDDK